MPFLVFLTRVAGVAFMASLIATRRINVVLDLDATLLESEMLLPETHPADWSASLVCSGTHPA